MLPKPEKIKKNSNSTEQLDLVDTLSKEKKRKNKRRYVLLFLILTVGLSFSFWIYRTGRSFFSQHPLSNLGSYLPKLNSSTSSSSDYQKEILSLIGNQPDHWSIYIKTLNSNKNPFIYSLNSSQITNSDQISEQLLHQETTQNSLTQQNLPQAIQVKEIINQSDSNFELNSLITVPQKQILIIIKVFNENSTQVKNKIPQIIEKIYWQIMNQN